MVILLTAEGVILSPRNMDSKTKSQRITAWVSFELIDRQKELFANDVVEQGWPDFFIAHKMNQMQKIKSFAGRKKLSERFVSCFSHFNPHVHLQNWV